MNTIGMPAGMWLLFAGSFRKQLIETLGCEAVRAREITGKAKREYKRIIRGLPEFEKGDRFKTNIVSCAMFAAFLLELPAKPTVDQTADYYREAMSTGAMKDQLEKNGLCIRHHLQHRETLDHPRVIGDISEGMAFDAVFAVMPYNKIGAILKSLAAIHTPLVVLVGNNMRPAEMREIILRETVCEKDVLFGFQATAGKRDRRGAC